eukprot:4794381-Pyramimonas_sp.AAC.1
MDFCVGSASFWYFYVSHGPAGIQNTRFGEGNWVVFGSPPARGLQQYTLGSRKQDCNIGAGDWN